MGEKGKGEGRGRYLLSRGGRRKGRGVLPGAEAGWTPLMMTC